MKLTSSIYFILISLIFLLTLGSCGDSKTSNEMKWPGEVGWPRWRGPNGDGTLKETDWNPSVLTEGPKILWNVDIGKGYSNIAIKHNRLYTMGKTDRKEVTVRCLNAETGKKIWQYSFESIQATQSTPTIDGKFVYTLGGKGILFCLTADNGKPVWQKDLVKELKADNILRGYSGSPVIEGDLLILNVNTSGIALNKETGDVIWISKVHKIPPLNGYHATPVIYDNAGERCALLFSGTGLFSVEVKTGKQLWFHEWYLQQTYNCADPVLFDNKVFISSGWKNARCALIDIAGNEPNVLWQNEKMRNEFSTCVYIDGYLYGIDGEPGGGLIPFRCIDVNTGGVMWEREMRMTSLTAADGKLIILEEKGILHIAEATPSSYVEISSGEIPLEKGVKQFWTSPVLYRGKIYCRNFAGELVCIDVSNDS